MGDRYQHAMARGRQYLCAHEFAAALGVFGEALRCNPRSPEAHYSYAFAAAEEIGSDLIEELAVAGVSLARLRTTWREALDERRHAEMCARVVEHFGKQKLFSYKLAVARARRRIARRCLGHLRRALIMQPHYALARELRERLTPLAATSPFDMLATLLH
ncbi:MAG TPA: hypothetical protein PLZ36_08725 [Armatimonadota bacterium]|nr:hypothetical protein [Armatimonadota bacterium]